MTHDRREHDGSYYATLVEASPGISGYAEGTPIETVLRGLNELISRIEAVDIERGFFTGDASIAQVPYALADSILTTWTLYSSDLIGSDNDVSVDPATFLDPYTNDPLDPDEIATWTAYSDKYLVAWMKFVVDDGPRNLRIHTTNSGADDTILFMWSGVDAPAGADAPYHLSDDGIFGAGALGTKAAFSSVSPDNVNGTDFAVGDAYAEDKWERGITLENGTYWIAICNYDYTDWASFGGDYVITFKPIGIVTGDAVIAHGVFTGEAVIAHGMFTGDAYIST